MWTYWVCVQCTYGVLNGLVHVLYILVEYMLSYVLLREAKGRRNAGAEESSVKWKKGRWRDEVSLHWRGRRGGEGMRWVFNEGEEGEAKGLLGELITSPRTTRSPYAPKIKKCVKLLLLISSQMFLLRSGIMRSKVLRINS